MVQFLNHPSSWLCAPKRKCHHIGFGPNSAKRVKIINLSWTSCFLEGNLFWRSFLQQPSHTWFLLSFCWKRLLGYSSWLCLMYFFWKDSALFHYILSFQSHDIFLNCWSFYLCINCLIKLCILNLPSSKSLVQTLNTTRPPSKKSPQSSQLLQPETWKSPLIFCPLSHPSYLITDKCPITSPSKIDPKSISIFFPSPLPLL